MGFPANYPSPGSNYFMMELLTHLERYDMVQAHRLEEPFQWVAKPLTAIRKAVLGIRN